MYTAFSNFNNSSNLVCKLCFTFPYILYNLSFIQISLSTYDLRLSGSYIIDDMRKLARIVHTEKTSTGSVLSMLLCTNLLLDCIGLYLLHPPPPNPTAISTTNNSPISKRFQASTDRARLIGIMYARSRANFDCHAPSLCSIYIDTRGPRGLRYLVLNRRLYEHLYLSNLYLYSSVVSCS